MLIFPCFLQLYLLCCVLGKHLLVYYCLTQQLKGHIEALEGLGSQVCADDLPQFNSRVQSIKEDILSAIADYIMVQTKVESDDTGGWGHVTWVGGVT